MTRLMLKLEPLIWTLFGGGMLVGAFLYPAWLAVVGLAVPLGLADGLSHAEALAIASSPLGRVGLAAAIVLPLWAGAHHLRHVAIDFGGIARDGLIGSLCYGVALVASILSIVAVVRI